MYVYQIFSSYKFAENWREKHCKKFIDYCERNEFGGKFLAEYMYESMSKYMKNNNFNPSYSYALHHDKETGMFITGGVCTNEKYSDKLFKTFINEFDLDRKINHYDGRITIKTLADYIVDNLNSEFNMEWILSQKPVMIYRCFFVKMDDQKFDSDDKKHYFADDAVRKNCFPFVEKDIYDDKNIVLMEFYYE